MSHQNGLCCALCDVHELAERGVRRVACPLAGFAVFGGRRGNGIYLRIGRRSGIEWEVHVSTALRRKRTTTRSVWPYWYKRRLIAGVYRCAGRQLSLAEDKRQDRNEKGGCGRRWRCSPRIGPRPFGRLWGAAGSPDGHRLHPHRLSADYGPRALP